MFELYGLNFIFSNLVCLEQSFISIEILPYIVVNFSNYRNKYQYIVILKYYTYRDKIQQNKKTI